MNRTTFCIVRSEITAERLVARITGLGFRPSNLSVLLPNRAGVRDIGIEAHGKAAQGAIGGAAMLGFFGGVFGYFVGDGSLATSFAAPLVAAGPLFSALGSFAVGSVAGASLGGALGHRVPEIEAKIYDGKIRGGNILVAVHTETDAETAVATRVFQEGGGHNIFTTAGAQIRVSGKNEVMQFAS